MQSSLGGQDIQLACRSNKLNRLLPPLLPASGTIKPVPEGTYQIRIHIHDFGAGRAQPIEAPRNRLQHRLPNLDCQRYILRIVSPIPQFSNGMCVHVRPHSARRHDEFVFVGPRSGVRRRVIADNPFLAGIVARHWREASQDCCPHGMGVLDRVPSNMDSVNIPLVVVAESCRRRNWQSDPSPDPCFCSPRAIDFGRIFFLLFMSARFLYQTRGTLNIYAVGTATFRSPPE